VKKQIDEMGDWDDSMDAAERTSDMAVGKTGTDQANRLDSESGAAGNSATLILPAFLVLHWWSEVLV